MAMHSVSEYMEHPNHRCFGSQTHDREALDKLAEGLQKRTPPRTAKELKPVATSFAVSRIPTIRGPSSGPLNFDTISSEDDDEIHGDVANDIRSVLLVSASFQFLNGFSMGYPRQFVKFASFLVDIWPAMFKWLVFLAEDVLDPVTSPYRTLANGVWPAAAYFLGEMMCIHDTPLVNIIPKTPGITRWAVRIWTQDIRLGWKQLSGRPYSLNPFVMGLLGQNPALEAAQAQVALDAAGGPKAMASSLLAHLNDMLSEFAKTPGLPFDTIIEALTAPVYILDYMRSVALGDEASSTAFLAESRPTRSRDTPPLLAALLCQGLMITVVNVLKKLTAHPPTSDSLGLFFRMSFWVTPCLFEVANAPCWISQALDAGLLLVLARSGPSFRKARHTEFASVIPLAAMVPTFLQSFLYYRSVLRSVARGIRVVEDATTTLERDALPEWRSLCKVAEFHLEMKKVFDKHKEGVESVSDCERPGCFEERGCQNVKRCSRCFAVFYCSKSCQVADWPTHKDACKRGREMLSGGVHIPMSKNDKAFVVHLARAVIAQSARSARSGSALLVDFRRHPCEVTPMKTDDEAHAHGVDADEWAELKRQARETGCIPWVAILVAPIGTSCYVRGLARLPTPTATA